MTASPGLVADPLSSSTPEVPKLRSSCEGCGNAKVKCDRGQPECRRCVAFGQSCVYGISRNFGKPSRKRVSTNLNRANNLSNRKRVKGTTDTCEIQRKEVEQSQVADESAQHTQSFHSSFDATERIESGDGCTSTLSAAKSQSTIEATQLNYSDSMTGGLSIASSINPTSGIYEHNSLDTSLTTPLLFNEWSEFDIWGPALEFPSVSKSTGIENRLSVSGLQSVSNPSTSMDSAESHSCPRGSYELFRDLICPSPFLHAPEANSDTVSAQFDEVLHFNRDAICRLSRLLKCPCAKSGHRAMVHASIVSRILIWYQQAAGWTGSSSWETQASSVSASSPSDCETPSSPPDPGTTINTERSSPLTLTQCTGFAVAQVPVSMGTFSIEDQNMQTAFRNQLILSELKKIASLIDLFICQGESESPVSGVTSLYSHLGTWLRNELLRTIAVLKARLHELNKTLES
ncbi:hypothetical protein BP6252_13018 [Coleophoma cylindrospora]|uniref:Zn(2)-C6 fungal-type domain-containing protein n=1 Tax=Coleophoma cylindrospora TaxID=1849047 RepID=A0A3D8QDZ2_9HELO|nr:hypothetical protein BP6252_13018 [Coleophoma cylindrospora]